MAMGAMEAVVEYFNSVMKSQEQSGPQENDTLKYGLRRISLLF